MDPQNLHDEEKKKAFQAPQISRRDLDAEPSQQQRAPLAEPEDMDLLGSEQTKVKEGTNLTGTSKKTVAAQELAVTELNKCTGTVDRMMEKVVDSDNGKHKELAENNSQTYKEKTVIETDTSKADRKQMKTTENAVRPVTEEMGVQTANISNQPTMSNLNSTDIKNASDENHHGFNSSIKIENLQIAEGSLRAGRSTQGEASKTTNLQKPKSETFDKKGKVPEDRIQEAAALKEDVELSKYGAYGAVERNEKTIETEETKSAEIDRRYVTEDGSITKANCYEKAIQHHQHVLLINHLKLIPVVIEKFPNVNYEETSECIKLMSSSEKDVTEARKYIDSCLSSLVIQKTTIRKPLIMALSKQDVEKFIYHQLEKKDVHCHWVVTENDNTLHVSALSNEEAEKALNMINENICTKTDIETDIASKLMLKFSGKCFKWTPSSGENKVTLVCTSDILKELSEDFADEVKKRNQSDNSGSRKEDVENSEKFHDNADRVGSGVMQKTMITDKKSVVANNCLHEIGKLNDLKTANDANIKAAGSSQISGKFENADWSGKSARKFAPRYSAHVDVDECLGNFIIQHSKVEEIRTSFNVSISKTLGQIQVDGEDKTVVTEVNRIIRDFANSVFVDYVLKPDPIKEYSEEWKAIQFEAAKHDASIYLRTIRHGPLEKKTHFKVGSTDICVGHGCVSDLNAVDLIVFPVNRSLFPITVTSYLMYKKGGENMPKAIHDMTTRYMSHNKDRHPPVGHVQFSKVVGNLPCSSLVYIVVGESYSDDEILKQKLLPKLIHILEKASEKRQTTVALPLEISRTFPVQESSKIVAEAIRSSIAESGSSVESVYLCVENETNLELAKNVCKANFEDNDMESFEMVDVFDENGDETKPGVNVQIVKGSIVHQQVDAIVCSIRQNFKLGYGVLEKSVRDSGGPEIGDELERQTKPSLGEIISTKAGKLNCKRVLFGSLPKYDDGEDYALKNLKLFLRNCFLAAMKDGCHSIAIPLLGTGNLNYPVLMVAREMFRAAHFCAAENDVHRVNFVLLEKDWEGQKIFFELQRRFQDLQNNQEHQPTGWRYLDVRISSLKTKISIVERADPEALVSDVVVRCEQIEEAKEGQKNYILTTVEPDSYVLNTMYFVMRFSQSPTEEDFKACLKQALKEILMKGYEYITLDFSNGCNNYTALGVDVLKSYDAVTRVQQIKFVSEEKMFDEFHVKHSSSKYANVTITEKIAGKFGLQHLWSAPNVTVTLKQYVPSPYTEAKTSWLALIYATDQQQQQKTSLQIEEYCKRSSGSSVDGDFISKKPILSERTLSEQTKLVSETTMSHTSGKVETKQGRNLKDPLDMTTEKTASDSDYKDDCEVEVFGKVEAVLSLETRSEQKIQTIADAITKSGGDGSLSMRLLDLKPYVKFDFCQRYIIKDLLTSMKDQGILDISKEQSEKVIENVDYNLFQLLLLYIREHHAETQIKQDFLKWDNNILQVDCDKELVDIVKSKINTLRSWNTETVGFDEDKYPEAVNTVEKLKEENPNVIAKLYPNEIQISGTSEYTAPAKHKVKIALGVIKMTGRRGRQFGKAYSSMPSQSLYEPTQNAKDVGLAVRTTADHKQYHTAEGIIVKVYKGNITNLQVDCIVNAANEQLSHGGGVAAAISRAAGPELQKESSRLVLLWGPLPVTECKETLAFDLPYKYVLHAVGPRFSDKSDINTLDQLSNTVLKVLRRAEELKMTSIALPSISAGIFGGQIDECAREYAKGVMKFSRETDRHVLNEIHFVDVQERFVQQIQSEFDILFTLMNSPIFVSVKACDVSGADEKIKSAFAEETSLSRHEISSDVTQPARELKKELKRDELENTTGREKLQSTVWTKDKTHTNPTKQNNDTEVKENFRITGNDKYHLHPKVNKNRTDLVLSRGNQRTYAEAASKSQGNPKLEKESTAASKQRDLMIQEKGFSCVESFISDKGINIIVRKGDIAMLNVDAIVCPENVDCSGNTYIAKSIKSVLSDDSVWKKAKTRAPIPESVLRIHIAHGLLYKYVLLAFTPLWQKGMNRKVFEQQIRRIIQRVFEESNTVALCSIAFPLIGVDAITGEDTTPFQICCNILCDEVFKFANDTSSSSTLKEINIMSLDEGIVFMCKEALTERFYKATTEVKLGTESKNTSTKLKKNEKCSVCKKNDVTISEVCHKCSEQRQKRFAIPTEANIPAYASMTHEVKKFHLPGFVKNDTICIHYKIESSLQKVYDPAQESRFLKTIKNAYLPANEQGLKILQLFAKALEQGLVFKVGKTGNICWSGRVEHKTDFTAYRRWGYPDDTYLSRVEQQLSRLGILPDLQPSEYNTVV